MANWRAAWRHLNRLPELVRCAFECEHPLTVALEYLRLRAWPGPWVLGLRGGLRLPVATYEDLVTAWIVFLRREYRIPADAATVVDLGANIGCFTLLAGRERPNARIVAIEPYPPTFARLRATLGLNGLGGRVTAWQLGVAAHSTQRFIPSSTAPSQSVGMLPAGVPGASADTPIDCRTLDELLAAACAHLGVEFLDFLKVDIEGAEHESLRAVTREGLRRVRQLGIEYHPNADKAELFAAIGRHGFELLSDRSINDQAGIAHFRRVG